MSNALSDSVNTLRDAVQQLESATILLWSKGDSLILTLHRLLFVVLPSFRCFPFITIFFTGGLLRRFFSSIPEPIETTRTTPSYPTEEGLPRISGP